MENETTTFNLIPENKFSSLELTTTAIEAIKPQRVLIGGPELPPPRPVGSYMLYFWKPERAKHSTLAMVDVTKQENGEDVATFVLRKEGGEEGKIAQNLRKAAQTDPRISLILSLYLPQVYQIDELSGWTAVEYAPGVEYKDLENQLKDYEFTKAYAEKVFELLFRISQTNLFFTDKNFVNGHNIKFDIKKGRIKFVEPDALDFSEPDKRLNDVIAETLFWELCYCSNHDFYRPGREEEDVDNSHKRNFLFELMQHISFLDGWENYSMGVSATIYTYEYLITNDPSFEKLDVFQKRDREKEFAESYELREHFSPEFIEAVKTGDREAFDKVVRAHHKFKVLNAYPKTNNDI